MTLKPGAESEDVTRPNKIGEKHRFRTALNGFSAALSGSQLKSVQRSDLVAAIEEEQYGTLATQNPTPNWGLDRIDQSLPPLDNQYSWDSAGGGVTAYVIDSGTLVGHKEFGGRALNPFDAFGGNGEDCEGHGTHVAGIIGGKNTGVAKSVTLRGLRVSDCAGNTKSGDVVAALEWVRDHAVRPAVVNLSLESSPSVALDQATASVIAAGIPVVVAAGNSAQDACNRAFTTVPKVIVVGATNRDDVREGYSNFGPCVDIHAPGTDILSADKDADGYGSRSGTSMAAPYVTGAVARYLAQHPDWSVDDVVLNVLLSASQPNLGNLPQGTTPRLLHVNPASSPLDTSIAYGYVKVVDQSAPLNTPVVPPSAVRRNSAGGLNTVTRTATGAYTVDFGQLQGLGGVSHVTSADNDGGLCKISTWNSDTLKQRVYVQCRDTLGNPKNMRFRVSYTRAKNSLGGPFGYLWAGEKSSPSYTPDSRWSYNSKGLDNTVSRESVGRYKVSFPGLGLSQPQGNVMVTAVDEDATYCKVKNWAGMLQTEDVYVNCYTPNGTPADARFDVTFTGTRSLVGTTGTRANAWTSALSGIFSPPSPPQALTWSFNSEDQQMSVEHMFVGYYKINIPKALSSFEGDFQVVAQGDQPHHCTAAFNPGTSGFDVSMSVVCKDAAGHNADSAFSLFYTI
ncbi:S8 family serine peptidase [Streptomyces sp. NPDC099088]|uniref:S8 family peptidase n=1 Tax=Streptomyces sp. NPDC099088 TaxID=3366101 RepID=UPI003802D230